MKRYTLTALMALSFVPIVASVARAQDDWLGTLQWCWNDPGKIGTDCPQVAARLAGQPQCLIAYSRRCLLVHAMSLANGGNDGMAYQEARDCECHNHAAQAILDRHESDVIAWLKSPTGINILPSLPQSAPPQAPAPAPSREWHEPHGGF